MQVNSSFQPPAEYAAGIEPLRIVTGDFNGDSKMDLGVLNFGLSDQDGTLSILLGNGDGTFQAPVDTTLGVGPDWLAVGDFNKDGKLDVAIVNGYPTYTLMVLLGNGDGTFQPPATYSPLVSLSSVAVGDFSRDGNVDIAVDGFDGAGDVAAILLGNGDGTFQTGVGYPIAGTSGLTTADFNGDASWTWR